ncbi:hypothetical protein GCM10009854_13550 [Saccharopolyspora halophila]|uniref:RNA polymerase sigma-70 region 4 domain-containing protein n=1 Tax=Saccharopolyspora halophila TaxID=405551 RepID=A0ABN3FVS9_9PSEU
MLDLREALSELTPKQRAVIVLRFSYDLSIDEVTAHVERPLNADSARLKTSLVYVFKGSSVTIALGEGAEAKQQADARTTENGMQAWVPAFLDSRPVLETPKASSTESAPSVTTGPSGPPR